MDHPIPSIKLIMLIIIVMFGVLIHGSSDNYEGTSRDMELENQLRILNKKPVKTIRTEIGDVFDCININKQPSLDHPLLKNHVIKTRPIFRSMVDDDDDHRKSVVSPLSSSSSSPLSSVVKHSSRVAILRKLGCPNGTVPIRRTSKEDLIRAESFSKSKLLPSSINNVVGDHQVDDLEAGVDKSYFLSIVKSRKYSGIRYLGIGGRINLYNVPVTENQASLAQLWIENGTLHTEFNSLQAGWMISPSLLGDNRTRIFGKFEIIGSNKREGCYNYFCLGFIQVDQHFSLGDSVNPTSQFGGVQYATEVAIYKDDVGNWWLEVGGSKIGYWPSELGFTQLNPGSSVIAWGGLAVRSGVAKTVPPTGNGHFPKKKLFYLEDFSRMCYMRLMKVLPLRSMNWEDPTRQILDTFVTPSLYGDNRTRLFGKWQVHGSNKSEGCYNVFCPGFIQVNKDYSLGGEISPTSQFKAPTQYEIKIAISKDGVGNWWLEVEDMKIGYWPSELGFSQLTRGSPVIAWGGLAAQLGGIATAIPPTGNGHYAYDSHFYLDLRRFCYMRVMKVIPVTTLNWEDPTRQIIDTLATNNKCSKIYYYGQLDRSYFQHTIGFGGPGGYCS